MESILQAFDNQNRWLYKLITDPTGARFSQPRDQATRLRQLQAHLERTGSFLNYAGDPQREFPAVHVAGTSGKGSVVAMIAAILSHSGLQTGYHLSPYLQVSVEKLVIDGHMIAPSEFVELVQDFRQQYEAWSGDGAAHLLYAEAWFALACLWLKRRQVDWAVIETSIGGRYDPTNLLPAKMAVITNVDFDHVSMLGPELSDIAGHKAGIIKEGGLAVTAATNRTVLDVIETEARQKRARLYGLGSDFYVSCDTMTSQGTEITVRTPLNCYRRIYIGTPGLFQMTNAALAITAADLLAAEYQLPVSEETIRAAMADFSFPGRMEIVQTAPLVILDGAHNPHKMQALVDSLQAIYPDKRITVIVGMLVSKDTNRILETLLPVAARFVVTQPHVYGKPALPPSELQAAIRRLEASRPIEQTDNVQDAIKTALQELAADEVLLITGSLYLVGEARDYWWPRDTLMREIEVNA